MNVQLFLWLLYLCLVKFPANNSRSDLRMLSTMNAHVHSLQIMKCASVVIALFLVCLPLYIDGKRPPRSSHVSLLNPRLSVLF